MQKTHAYNSYAEWGKTPAQLILLHATHAYAYMHKTSFEIVSHLKKMLSSGCKWGNWCADNFIQETRMNG